jgi:two-component system chemotaxis response regulator CheY
LKEGFTVVAEATNGDEAIDKYKIHTPMITLMDIFMPELNGIDATKEIVSFDKDATVLICSGVGLDEDVKAAIHAGARDVIYKPFFHNEVIASINKALKCEVRE